MSHEPSLFSRVEKLASRAPALLRPALSSGTLFLGAAAQFAWFIILARALGVTAYGQLMLITSASALGAWICGLGGGEGMIRRTARNREDYRLLLGHNLILIAATGLPLVVITAGGLAFMMRASPLPLGNAAILIAFCLSYIVLFRFVGFIEQVFIAQEQYNNANLVNILFSAVRLAAAALACLFFHVHTLSQWAVWTLAAHVVCASLCWMMTFPLGAPLWRIDRRELGLGFHYTTPRITETLRQNIDRIVLGLLVAPALIGSYAAAAQMARTSQIVITAVGRVMYPSIVRTAELGRVPLLRFALIYAVGITALAVLTGAAVHLIAPALPWILGPKYAPVVGYLQLLCWMTVPLSLSWVPIDILLALDKHSQRATIYNVTSTAGAGLVALLTFAAGVKGAIAGAYTAQILLTAVMWAGFFHASRRTGEAVDDGWRRLAPARATEENGPRSEADAYAAPSRAKPDKGRI